MNKLVPCASSAPAIVRTSTSVWLRLLESCARLRAVFLGKKANVWVSVSVQTCESDVIIMYLVKELGKDKGMLMQTINS